MITKPLKLFITGTDTDIGKTYISVGLLKYFGRQGFSTLGIKPIACPSVWHGNSLRNRDALSLLDAASIKLAYEKINPFAFEPAIAPHIAASQQQRPLTANNLLQQCQFALNYLADVCIVEGVGGWYTPLNASETMADFVKLAHLKVILVVGIRLGCLNHAILTYQALKNDGVAVVGWIANCIDPKTPVSHENISTLQRWFDFPCLGIVLHNENPANVLQLELNDF